MSGETEQIIQENMFPRDEIDYLEGLPIFKRSTLLALYVNACVELGDNAFSPNSGEDNQTAIARMARSAAEGANYTAQAVVEGYKFINMLTSPHSGRIRVSFSKSQRPSDVADVLEEAYRTVAKTAPPPLAQVLASRLG